MTVPTRRPRESRLPRLRIAGLALLLILGTLTGADGAGLVRASAGVPLPAEFGSEWIVIAGYNTYSHTSHDVDALDIVRLDAPTSGSVVLSPVVGTVRHSGGDCLSVEDGAGLSHLLCHFFPDAGFERGTQVVAGQRLGAVAPDGFAGNNGIAHIHYAVHQDGNGQTLPFSWDYALEGVNLLNSGAWNEHANRTFVSSNLPIGAPAPNAPPAQAPGELEAPEASPPDASVTAAPPALAVPEPEPIEAAPEAPVQALAPGWNLVSWPAEASLRETVDGFNGAVTAVLAFEAVGQHYRIYSAFLPDAANTLDSIRPGAAVWLSVTSGDALEWPEMGAPSRFTPRLSGGFNLVAWTGLSRSVTEAIAPIAQWVESVHSWDADAQRFRVYRPDAPSFLNDLTTLRSGEGVWVRIRSGISVSWSQR